MTAYPYPLLIKQILTAPLAIAPEQQIIHGDVIRYDYSTFAQRVSQAAGALRSVGVTEGSVVAVMDWDSHRYLESFL